jgi:hypothetical protein
MSLIRISVCLTIILGLGNVALADMQILSATPSQTDRFSGSGNFAFSQFDFSGVGNTSNGTGTTGTTPGTDGTFDAAGIGTGQWGTLIAPGYFLTAAHDRPAVGSNLNFYANPSASNGFSAQVIVTDQVVSETQLTFVNTSGQTVASDLMLGKLATPATGVTFYSIDHHRRPAVPRRDQLDHRVSPGRRCSQWQSGGLALLHLQQHLHEPVRELSDRGRFRWSWVRHRPQRPTPDRGDQLVERHCQSWRWGCAGLGRHLRS